MHSNFLQRLTFSKWAIDPSWLHARHAEILRGNPLALPRSRAESILSIPSKKGEGTPVVCSAGYQTFTCPGESASYSGNLPPCPVDTTVLLLWGILGRGWDDFEKVCYDAIEVDEVAAAIAATPLNSRVVLWFRSPGGITTGIPETAQALRDAAGSRALLAFSDDLCASAAYWLAAQCGVIHATQTSQLGSIGVYCLAYDYCKMLEDAGIALKLWRDGEMKGAGIVGKPWTEAESAHVMASVLASGEAFRADVLRNRELEPETMQGQCYEGGEAMDRNLCDKLWLSAAEFFASLRA